MPTKVYLAGPMSGHPQFNIPAFDAAAEDLRDRGLDVVSPAELDDPEYRKACLASTDGLVLPDGESYGTLMARDIKVLADDGIEAVVVLMGWRRSKGALLETYVARLLGLPVFEYTEAGRPLWGITPAGLDASHTVVVPHYEYVLYIPTVTA